MNIVICEGAEQNLIYLFVEFAIHLQRSFEKRKEPSSAGI
jgi:hypothetical protein